MKIEFDPTDMSPLVRAIAKQLLDELDGKLPTDNRMGYTEEETAQLLGIPYTALRDHRLAGHIQPAKIGRRFIYGKDLIRGELLKRSKGS